MNNWTRTMELSMGIGMRTYEEDEHNIDDSDLYADY